MFRQSNILSNKKAMASKHVPLNQTPDFDSHRKATMDSAKCIFNLMTLACATTGQYRVISDMFERSLRFSPKEDHVWAQFALAMAAEGRLKRSLVVLTEVAQQRPNDSSCTKGVLQSAILHYTI